MSKGKSGENDLSVEEMRGWLLEETQNILKECELRIRDATDFTTAYASGKLSVREANKRLRHYETRWADALEGVYASSYKTDEAIVNAIDKAHRADRTRWQQDQKILNRADRAPPGFQR